MTALRALVWDVDGTLAETERDGHLPAFNQAFADAGLPWRWSEPLYAELLATTGGKERLLDWWRAVDPHSAATPDAPARVAALHAAKTALYTARVAAGAVALRPGVARLLAEARAAGVVLAIATTTTRANVLALLRATLGEESPAWFAAIVAGDEVARKKPAPDAYQAVLAQLGLPASAALAIEDSAAGVRAARAAGLPVLLTRSAFGPSQAGMPPVLADLDGLGEPGASACGLVPREASAAGGVARQGAWRGAVRWADLVRWHGVARRAAAVASAAAPT